MKPVRRFQSQMLFRESYRPNRVIRIRPAAKLNFSFRPLRFGLKPKMTTYECGIETVGDSWVQFKAQYYIFALVFLVFDVETVFLFPWAVKLNQLGVFAVLEGIVFILILIAGLAYTWRKGMLEWA